MRALALLPLLAMTAAAQEPSLSAILSTVAGYASGFDSAAGWVAEETMTQRGLESAKTGEKPEMASREITGLYGFTSDPAIHEVRAVTSVDGHARGKSRGLFEAAVRGGNQQARRKLLDEFNGASINVAANDFGPLLLLFTRPRQADYDFALAGTAMIGADTVLEIRYRQNTGSAALHLKEGLHRGNAALTGRIAVRDSDFMPLRVTLVSERKDVRDEAEVDYVPRTAGLLLPVAIVYRRYVGDQLVAENRSRFTGWHKAAADR